MSTTTLHGTHGASATGPLPHPRHRLGNALRATRVWLGSAFEVVLLGRVDTDAGVVGPLRHHPAQGIPAARRRP